MKSLNESIFKSIITKLLTYAIQFIVLIVYTRIFTPNEFGFVASLYVFFVFFQLFSDVGIGPALINEKEISDEERNGVYTFTFIIGVVVAILFYLFSFFLGGFYNGQDYKIYALLISISVVFQSMCVVPMVALQKETKFYQIGISDVSAEFLSLIGVLALYYYNFGVYALASRTLLQSIIKFLCLRFFSMNTEMGVPRFGRQIKKIKKIIKFSIFQFAFNFVNYFSRNLDNILVGKYFGINSLGVYDKSYQLMKYPLMLVSYAMAPAIQPVLSHKRNDVTLVVNVHNQLTKMLLLIAIPISFYIYTNANSIVFFLFGYNWRDVAPILKIFSVIIPLQMVLSTSGAFFQSMNRPELLFYSGAIAAFINVIAIVVGVLSHNLESLAVYICISYSINFIVIYIFLFAFCFKQGLSGMLRVVGGVLIRISMPMYSYVFLKKFTDNFLFASGGSLNIFYALIFYALLIAVLMIVFNYKYILSNINTFMSASYD